MLMLKEFLRSLRLFSATFDEREQVLAKNSARRSLETRQEELKDAKRHPLTLAAYNGDFESVLELLNTGAKPNSQTRGRDTPLSYAAGNGHIDIVRLLLERGTLVDAGDGAALKAAAFRGHSDVVQVLLTAGADVRLYTGSNDRTSKRLRRANEPSVLEYAAHGGELSIVRALLSQGADPNAGAGSALAIAARQGNIEIVGALLEAGADLNWRSRGGYTALATAAVRGHAAIVRLLLDRDAAVTDTVLRMARARPGNEAVIQLVEAAIRMR